MTTAAPAAPAAPAAASTTTPPPAAPAAAATTTTTTTGAPDASAAAAAAGSPPPAAAAAGTPPAAPATYTLTVPADAQAFYGARQLAKLEADARAAHWTNADAQAELDEQVAVIPARRQAQLEAWRGQTQRDPDYGGARLSETQRLSKLAIDAVRPLGHARRDTFLAFLTGSGGTDHPEVVAFLADLGTLMAEDRPGAPGQFARGAP